MENPTVFVGRNTMLLSQATMAAILTAWLHEHVSGGPYKVLSVTEDGDDFQVTFVAVEKPKEGGGG